MRTRIRYAAAATAAALATLVHAQTASPSAVTASETSSEEAVQLPQFTVSTSPDDKSLVSQESISTNRIAVDTFNLPSTVTVINRSFLNAINPQAFSDVFNYVGGGQPGTISWTSGRYIFRGFVADGDYQDGFNISTQSNVDEFIFDRVEIILAANSIENSSTPPGGVPNKITKSPTDIAFGSLGIEYGAFDAGEARLDVGGPITKDHKLQYRVIATQTDYHGYYDNTPFHRSLGAVMLKYQFTPDTQLTIKEWYWKTYFPSYNPPPLDPNTLTYWPGLSYKRDTSEDDPVNWRKEQLNKTDLLFTSRLSPWAALRVSGTDVAEKASRVESVATSWTSGQVAGAPTIQPGSGEFASAGGGTTFIAPYVEGVSLLPRSTTAQQTTGPLRDIQSDLDFNFNTGPVSHNFLIGGEFVDASARTWTYTGTSSPIDIYVKTAPTVTVNLNTPTGLTNNLNQTAKLYMLETAGFFHDRILLDYGYTRIENTQAVENDLLTPHTETTPQYYIFQNLRTYGAVLKIIPSVALFFNNSISLGTITPPNNNVPVPVGLNKSQELGIRGRFLDNHLNARISYFQALSTNNSVPSFPLNPAAPNVLIAGTISHGFDGDASWTFNKNLTVLATFADYHAYAVAQPANVAIIQPGLVGPAYGVNGAGFSSNASDTLPTQVPVDDVAEHTFSLFSQYSFTDPALKGLDVAAGLEYECKRAITDNANQIFFGYIPGRTLVNVYANYRWGHYLFSLNIDNVFDQKYFWSARSVNVIEPGTPINFKGTVTYSF